MPKQDKNRETAQAVLTGVRLALSIAGVPTEALFYRYIMQEAQTVLHSAATAGYRTGPGPIDHVQVSACGLCKPKQGRHAKGCRNESPELRRLRPDKMR